MMNSRTRHHRGALTLLLGAVLMVTVGVWSGWAADQPGGTREGVTTEQEAAGSGVTGMAAIGAGLAIGLAALGTGLAQSRIGAAGIGAVAEDPKRLGVVIMLIAIPETVAILGFVIAYLILA